MAISVIADFNLLYLHGVSKKRAPYNNVNNLRTEVPIHSLFGAPLGLPIWHIPTNFGQYILKNEDSGEFSARKGCTTQWPSWEISIYSVRDSALKAVKISLFYFYLLCWLWNTKLSEVKTILIFQRQFLQWKKSSMQCSLGMCIERQDSSAVK